MTSNLHRGRQHERLPRSIRRAASPGIAAALVAALLLGCSGGDKGGDGGTGPTSGIQVALDPPSLALAPGASVTTAVTVTRRGDFDGAVDLELTGAPAGVTASFEPRRVSGDAATSTLTIAVGTEVAKGAYSLQVRASGAGAGEERERLSLTVGEAPATGFGGTLTFAGGSVWPEVVVDLDAASGRVTPRFTGIDPHRTRSGEAVFLTAISGGGGYPDVGVVVADAQGAIGGPVYVCPSFNFVDNRVCHTPKLSPDTRLVAFGAYASSSADQYTLTSWVLVHDRNGAEVARFEGFAHPDWTPDGRLVMMSGAGVWVSDAALRTVTRVDHGQVGSPATMPAVSPDGRRVAFVWNEQLWTLTLDGRGELARVDTFDYAISAVAWSPDGSAFAVIPFDVVSPLPYVMMFHPGDAGSAVAHPLSFYPYGPISWR